MILVAAALAADLTVLGVLDGQTLRGNAHPDGLVELQWPDGSVTVDPPAPRCDTHLALGADGVHIRWICGAQMTKFGSVTERTWFPGDTTSRPTVDFEDGIDWLVSKVEATDDPLEATGLVSQFASRLQYAASAESREAVLLPLLDQLIRATNADREAGDPRRAALRVHAFLMSPPVWEPERPWDHGQRLRVGAPAGNRPAPDRTAWITATPANLQRMLALANVLQLGGSAREAEELLTRLAKLDPESGAVHALLGDARWARGDTEGAREAYTRAKALGFVPARLDRRLPPG